MQKQTTQSKSAETPSFHDSDIVDFLLKDHKPLKKWVKIMKDSEKPLAERIAAFQEFAPALIAHSKPEEETFYARMKHDEELRAEAFEGEVEHGLADQMLEEIKRTTDDDLLSARIKVLAELVEHHILEEESLLIPDFVKEIGLQERAKIGNHFLQAKADYLAAGSDNIIPDQKAEFESKH
ncbi:MAG: hemerythrin domain-containing protein [Pseudobdellovibrio sp.]